MGIEEKGHQENLTFELIKIIGTPFLRNENKKDIPQSADFKKLFDYAWENRVELLYLHSLEGSGYLEGFEEKKKNLEERSLLTRKIASDVSRVLQKAGVEHIVYKTIKPFPATPNDTDVVCLGDEKVYQKGLQALTKQGYGVLAEAPMQILMYHPLGEGKVGGKKKGGTWYVDYYRGVAVDYFEYINKKSYLKYHIEREIEGRKTILLAPEPELAIILFHNIFPEKTCHLEQFYLCLFALSSPSFNLDLFIRFTEENFLERGVQANLTIFETLHQIAFGFTPRPLKILLDQWGYNETIQRELSLRNYKMQFIFSGLEFWKVFLSKLRDPYSRKSLNKQFIHMLKPKQFIDVMKAVWTRTFSKDIYGHK